jgi:hypothetical protein
MEYCSDLKKMSYQPMKRHRGNVNAYYQKKENLKGYMAYESNHMTSWKRQNYGNSKISCCQELWTKEERVGKTQECRAVKLFYVAE